MELTGRASRSGVLRKRIGRRTLAALVLSYAGIALVFADGLATTPQSGDVALGAALDVPLAVHGLVPAMAVVSTFVPVWCW